MSLQSIDIYYFKYLFVLKFGNTIIVSK